MTGEQSAAAELAAMLPIVITVGTPVELVNGQGLAKLGTRLPRGKVSALWPSVRRAEVDWDDGLTTTVPLEHLRGLRPGEALV